MKHQDRRSDHHPELARLKREGVMPDAKQRPARSEGWTPKPPGDGLWPLNAEDQP